MAESKNIKSSALENCFQKTPKCSRTAAQASLLKKLFSAIVYIDVDNFSP